MTIVFKHKDKILTKSALKELTQTYENMKIVNAEYMPDRLKNNLFVTDESNYSDYQPPFRVDINIDIK